MKLNDKLELFLVSLMTSLLVFSFFVAFFPKPKTIATVDLNQIIKPMIEAELKNPQPMEMKKIALQKKIKQLHEQLKSVSDKQNLVLVPKEAVIAGALDKTTSIQPFINPK